LSYGSFLIIKKKFQEGHPLSDREIQFLINHAELMHRAADQYVKAMEKVWLLAGEMCGFEKEERT